MESLYTVGHSQHEISKFISLLKQHKINYLIDVRSTPYSRYSEQYNRENIRKFLSEQNIKYVFMGEYFGARMAEKTLYTAEGYLDFEKVIKTERFIKGRENIMKGIHDGNRVALMCTEKNPIECHRTIMVSRAFYKNDIDIKHILPDGDTQSQREIEEILLEQFYPDRNQINLFNMQEALTEEEYIDLAYKKQNKVIGYTL